MNETTTKTARLIEPSPPSFTINDVYFIFFRHWGKITLFSLLGLLGAVVLYLHGGGGYQSQAKLLIRYVLEKRTGAPPNPDSQVMSPSYGGDSILNTEMEILTSFDLATNVAELIGPSLVLEDYGGGNDKYRAAAILRNALTIEVPRRSTILTISLSHPNPRVAQSALQYLIDTYLRRHLEIHGVGSMMDGLISKQMDQIKADLRQTEEQLRKLKNDINVISMDEAKTAFMDQLSRLKQDLLTAEAELAERRAMIHQSNPALAAPTEPPPTNTVSIPAEQVVEYRTLVEQLDALEKDQRRMSVQWKNEHPGLRALREQIAEKRAERSRLEQMYTGLVSMAFSVISSNGTSEDLAMAMTRSKALEGRIAFLKAEATNLQAQASALIEAEPRIVELQRKRDLQETNYRYYQTSLEQARLKDTLDDSHVTNIKMVQAPTAPVRMITQAIKPAALSLFGGVAVGIGLALLLELFVNQTARRSSDLEKKLRRPVFFNLPDRAKNGRWRVFRGIRFRRNRPRSTAVVSGAPGSANGQLSVAPWDKNHALREHFDALRDRLITYFEVKNMTHKPKLVAVTGCAIGSGVSTLAVGLAAALSETGDGNVLIVDMTHDHGPAHGFHQGKPTGDLDDLLDQQKRSQAQLQDNLFIAAEKGGNGALARVLPKRFMQLVPKLKVSDYDYIIFDMPPVGQTSVTPRLARFMDMVLLVVEAEKTHLAHVKQASTVLAESGAQVGTVLNKVRSHVPRAFSDELA